MSRPFSTENVFRALAHRTRRQIVESLRRGDRYAGELLEGADLSAPSLSAHLRVLRQCEIVTFRRRGNRLLYQLNASALRHAATWLATFDRSDAARRRRRQPAPRTSTSSGAKRSDQ